MGFSACWSCPAFSSEHHRRRTQKASSIKYREWPSLRPHPGLQKAMAPADWLAAAALMLLIAKNWIRRY